ncbi:hypothetical protein F2Q69_00003343 [Brassica cretica]|uniref:Uncharacterized protein n=1 Tax=Brassica cretica TaxID=69181 RepID=A0A8S9NYF6_BRACR|nr:hypothetical protein F2Q69_00003343 [Brassica cretica]
MPQFYDDSVDHLPGIFGPLSSEIGAWSFRLLWIETNRSICSDGSRFGFGELWRRFRDINQSQSKLFTIQSTYMIYFNKDAWKFHMSDSVKSNQHLLSSNTLYLILNLELIVINIKGRVRVWRDYHGDVSVAQAQRFFSKLSGLGNILRQQHVASLWMLGGVLLVQLIFPKKQIAVSTQPRKAEKIHHMRRRVDRFKELMNA